MYFGVEVLGTLPAEALSADAVLDRLDHADARVREWAVAAVARLAAAGALPPPLAARARDALLARATDDDRRVRERAAALHARLVG